MGSRFIIGNSWSRIRCDHYLHNFLLGLPLCPLCLCIGFEWQVVQM